jgi:EAL domain-containing protein (putative c-di-GMP-specific phosphodiesterase class I)
MKPRRTPVDEAGTETRFSSTPRTAIPAVIDIARALDIEVVGEGIESRSQAELLFELGCNYAQGFHFARPAPADSITPLL